jgi:hypothetical protein
MLEKRYDPETTSFGKRVCQGCGLYQHLEEDGYCSRCLRGPEKNPTLEQRKAWARAHADLVVRVLNRQTRAWHLYTPEDLVFHARRCHHHCLKFQLHGGRPDA